MKIYNDGNQVEILFDYWPDKVDWFIVGGTANSGEAQTVYKKYPDINYIGFEPNPEFVYQQNNHFNFPGVVHEFALWEETKELLLSTPQKATSRSSSVCRPYPSPDMGKHKEGTSYPVLGRTLDSLSKEFGPFENSVLWIDIEYAEIPCLRGATRLLQEGKIKLINLETFSHIYLPEINRILTGYGFMLQKIWNIGTDTRRDAQDIIFKLEH